MSRKFFYATTTEIPTDGWAFTNDDPIDDILQLKPVFTEKRELIVHSEVDPWQSLSGQTLPDGTAMVACWIETEPDVIDLYGDLSLFVGDLRTGILPWRGRPGNYIVLHDGRALQVYPDELEFVQTIPPTVFGLESWSGQSTFCKRVYDNSRTAH